MRVTKTDLEKALLKMVSANILLEKLEEIANEWKVDVENLKIDGEPYKKVFEDAIACLHQWEDLIEGAKETVVDGLDDQALSLFNKMSSFDGGQAQKYYLMERYANLTYIVDRAKQIKPLYTKKRVPVFIKRKYRETILCYFDGRFDACCVICRSVVEMLLKALCEKKFDEKRYYKTKSLSDLIHICEKWNILSSTELKAIKRIKETGNKSVHTKKMTSEQEALSSIEDTQKLLQGVFSDKKMEI